MDKIQILEAYQNAPKPFSVCFHTYMGSYMEFCTIERDIMFEENARMICDSYAETAKKNNHGTFKGVCVRKDCETIYEVNI